MDRNHYDRAMVLEASGRMEDAVAELRELIRSTDNPAGDGLAFVVIADVLRELGHHEEARKFVNQVCNILTKKDEQYPYIMYVDACIDEELQDWKSALAKLDLILKQYSGLLESTEHDDLKAKILRIKGIALTFLNRDAEAHPLLELALSKNLERETTLCFLGACCSNLGDLDAAERYLKEALSLQLDDPSFAAKAHRYLANVHFRRGRFAWAKQELEWCLEYGSEHLRKEPIIKDLIGSSKALGLDADVERYSEMLRRLQS